MPKSSSAPEPLTPEELLAVLADIQQRLAFLEQWAAMRTNPEEATQTV